MELVFQGTHFGECWFRSLARETLAVEENSLLQAGRGYMCRVEGGRHKEGEDHGPERVPGISHQAAHKLLGRKSLRTT